MALHVYIISEYNYLAEIQQFEAISQLLQEKYKDRPEECILIGNYNIEGVELDGLLITSGGFRILEFKNWGGKIIARENGSWTSNNLIIEGGAGKKTPFEQVRLNRSRATKGLANLLGIKPLVSAAIIFWQNAEIDDSQLSGTVKTWLKVCDNQHLSCILNGMDGHSVPEDFVRSVPNKLKLEEFSTDSKARQTVAINESYEPEASTNFFDELEIAIQYRPNYRKVYNALNQTFKKCLNQKTSLTRINFGGDFAKTDYLLKEYGASRHLVKVTNDTRARLRKRHDLSDSDLEKYHLLDLKNLCQFIAFIYKSDIPQQLIDLFPIETVTSFTPALVGECMRVIVENWDDDFVYVQTEESTDGELQKVCYSQGNQIYSYDWTYFKDMFYRGVQLNLIRPREEAGIIYPELIIFEPDYLVNISTIAHCFTNYADSPFVELIKKLESSQTKDAIVLGNLAGKLLDDTIHHLPNTYSYEQSVKDFFKDNAISLLTIEGGHEFHDKGRTQKQNIAQAIFTLKSDKKLVFNEKEGILEPSFFSEMLGLQGRMDYLQMDFKILMEQKSGKGAFPYDNFVIPKHTDEHYVQMLLYVALIRYNYREIYERIKGDFHAYLLYSKYSESLLDPGYAALDLLFKAIKIRNELAWTEMLFTQPNGYRLLDELTPEQLNIKHLKGNFWDNCVRPRISGVLDPIHQASDLEKAYYYRFLTFIANEHVMSKLGNKTKDSSGFAATWHDSLEEKRQAGNIYDGLTLLSPTKETTGRIKNVELKFSENEDNDMSNFRVGDIVILYSYTEGKEPDARKTMVHRCTIESIGTDTIRLALRATQADNRVFVAQMDNLWAIEHDFMESSYSSLYKGMQAFLTAPKSRRDLLLLQREPQTDKSIGLKGDYGEFNELMLEVKQAKDMFLIIGPPGTGKTSFGLLNTVKEELEEPDANILLLSYTNRAVDEICSKLTEHGIDYIRIGGAFSCAEEYKDKLLSARVEQSENIITLKNTLLQTKVFVGTTTALNSNIALFQLKQYTLAVIDEASQILEPHLIGLLSAHKDGVLAIKKFVLIGDHKQLPAVVQQTEDVSKVQDVLLNDIHLTDCRLSLFERLYRKYGENEDVTGWLYKQGRMHHDIAIFPNYAFYGNKLKEVGEPTKPHQNKPLPLFGNGENGIVDLLKTRRIVFIATDRPKNSPSDKVNQTEAEMIAATVVKIYEIENTNGFDVKRTVGVIVPYRNQIATVRNEIDKYGIKLLHDITIDTVERYQGSQRKYIVYGFTVQKYYQLNFLASNVFEDEKDGCIVDRKLNVAMTRAEEHLVMFGNAELLSNNFTFFKLMEFVRSKHGFFRVKKNDFVAGNFEVPQYETEELDISQATFTLSDKFKEVFGNCVLQPIKNASGNEWPSKVFGHDKETNLGIIGYGRINFSNQIRMFNEQMSPEQQVLIYCYYIMRQHYCSSRNIFTSYKDWLTARIASVSGRVQMIDIGCGPATCGVAFAEIFRNAAPNIVYTGIDISICMKQMGKKLLDNVFDGQLHSQMKESLNELDSIFWEGCSELPSLVIFNMSYFFSNVTALFTERLAIQISEIMRKYPLNRYLFFIQHSECDKRLNSFKVFKQVLKPLTTVTKSEEASFSYLLNYKERTLEFCYDIWTSK